MYNTLSLCGLISVIIMLTSTIQGQKPAFNDVASSYSEEDPILLFNGENLDGWYTFLQNRGKNIDPKGVYSVMDGMIRISGEEWGGLTTTEAYENYRITLSFKWGEKTYKPREKMQETVGYY